MLSPFPLGLSRQRLLAVPDVWDPKKVGSSRHGRRSPEARFGRGCVGVRELGGCDCWGEEVTPLTSQL